MGLDKRSVLVIVLCIISIIFTLYTVKAHRVARAIVEWQGELYWRDSGGGWFLPWPPRPGGVVAPVILPIKEEVTLFIYRYLIKTRVLVGLSILIWAVTGLFIIKARKSLIPSIRTILSRLRALPW